VEYSVATIRRLAPGALLVAALAVTTAACGSPNAVVSSAAPSGTAARPVSTWDASVWFGGDPLAGRSAGWIIIQAIKDTEAAPVVRIQGTVVGSGKAYTLNLSMMAGHGCAGTLTAAGSGTFTMISDGRNLWLKPDPAFWRATGADEATLGVLESKYLEAKLSDSGASAMASMCSVQKLLSKVNLDHADDETRGGLMMIDGQRALEISDTADLAYGYVSDVAQPVLLQVTDPARGDTQVNFAYPRTPPTITPPPASETIDGSQYGF
jgi:hypothetical protein